MDKTVLAVRAISSQYAKRILLPLLAIGVGVYVVVICLIWWIVSISSAWWWLLAIIPTFIVLVAVTIWVVAWVIVSRISPAMNLKQKRATKRFITRIDKVAEHIGTPKFLIIYRIVRDVIAQPTSSKTFIGEIAQEPGEMRRAFDDLRSLF